MEEWFCVDLFCSLFVASLLQIILYVELYVSFLLLTKYFNKNQTIKVAQKINILQP
jgi:hypothetical protein